MNNMRCILTTIVLLAAMLSVTASPVLAADLDVINHVFATRVVQGQDGGFYPQDTIIGFEQGTASFHTITQVVLASGQYNITLELLDPGGKEVMKKTLPTVHAQHDDWAEALWVEWRNVSFQQTGRYVLRMRVNNETVATFYLLIS